MIRNRIALLAVSGLLAACVQGPGEPDRAAATANRSQHAPARPAATIEPAIAFRARMGTGFARLPDRGELVAYVHAPPQQDGAYTWYRTDLSEAHALDAIANGRLRFTTPAGRPLEFLYDRHVEHPSGDWTWIGHLAGQEGVQAILTFGATAAYGWIAQPGERPLRLTTRDGAGWMVQTDVARLATVVGSVTSHPDYILVPRPQRDPYSFLLPGVRAAAAAVSRAGTGSTDTIDIVVGYTPGFAAAQGGNAGAVTRLHAMVDYTNAAYVRSGLNAVVRLMAAVPVNYTDSDSNNDALEKLSGFQAPSTVTTPDPAFDALRAARETYGADLVSLVRKFQTPENQSCGVAWLLGGGKQGIDQGWEFLGYSVVSDGQDHDEVDGHDYYCEEHTFAHELGHNMGLAHDRETSKGDDGVLDDPDDYGVSDYSFGYKMNLVSGGGFSTIMAYGDANQNPENIFSDPRVSTCGPGHGVVGTKACGIPAGQPEAADASLSLSQTMSIVATFRATAVPVGVDAIRNDFDGDGMSDLLWRNIAAGSNAIWRSANSATQRSIASLYDLNWKVAGVADFDHDGKADILWRNSSTGANVLWRSADSATISSLATLATTWSVAGLGDFDGDGKADILWRNGSTGANRIWRSGNSGTQQAVTALSDLNWKVGAVEDFNGDGKDDIAWRHATTGSDAIWLSANSATPQAVTRITDVAWRIVGAADFNGDGKADLLWRNFSSGADTIWRSGNSATTQGVTGVTNLSWKIVALGDYNGDGKADLVWRNSSTGANVLWRSAVSTTSQSLTGVGNQSWVILP